MKTCNYANKIGELESLCTSATRSGDTATLEYVYDEAMHCYNNTNGTISDRFASVALEAEEYLEQSGHFEELEEELEEI